MDLLPQFGPLNFPVDDHRGLLQPFFDVHLLKDFLFLLVVDVHHGNSPVGNPGRVLDVGKHAGLLIGQVWHRFDQPLVNLPQVGNQSAHFQTIILVLLHPLDLGPEIGTGGMVFVDHHPDNPLDNGRLGIVGHVKDFHDHRQCAPLVQIILGGHFHRAVLLSHHHQHLAAGGQILDQFQRLLTPNINWDDLLRKQDRIA